MSKSRIIVIAGSFILTLLLVASWFLLLSPRMATAGDLDTERVGVVTANDAAQTRITELQEMSDNIATAKANADELTKRFPPTAEQAELFALVKKAARSSGIPERNVTSLTVGIPALGTSDGSVTLPEAAPPVAGSPGAEVAPAAPAPVLAPVGQLGSMTLDATVTGTRAEVERFLRALENMDRALLIESVTFGAAGGTDASVNVTGKMFLLPELVDPTAIVAAPQVNADGSTSTVNADGSTSTVNADGSTSTVNADGSTTIVSADGKDTATLAPGVTLSDPSADTTTPEVG